MRAAVVGGGIGGLASAALLARAGADVTLLERHDQVGGRARVWERDGFRFDMGPSWYLMPDVFAQFFALFGRRVEDYLTLRRLAPSYRIWMPGVDEPIDLYSDVARDGQTLERFESGAAAALRRYVERSGHEYALSMRSFIHRRADSPFDFLTPSTVRDGMGLPLLKSLHATLAARFSSDAVRRILEYQALFLGTAPQRTPGVYAAMNYVDFAFGVHYPDGGIGAVRDALLRLCEELGVGVRTSIEATRIRSVAGRAVGVALSGGETVDAETVVVNADYWWAQTRMLAPEDREYPERYWERKTPAPSAFILYLGIDGVAERLAHHNLLFPADWDRSFTDLFAAKGLPAEPSLYVCCPSKTDPSVAPNGCENLFVLQPIAAGLTLTEAEKARYTETLLDTLETRFGIADIRKRIRVQRLYTVDDFANDYHAFRGNALAGLAHTLGQSSLMRPRTASRKVKGLYFVGAGANPGIGMPMCLISAQIVLKHIAGVRSERPLTEVPTVAAPASAPPSRAGSPQTPPRH